MKKYLITWYGITDLKASLGHENTTGPVLGALLAEDYTNLVILGFTNLNKAANEEYSFQQKIVNTENDDSSVAKPFLTLFSNTAEAHVHFIQWLEKQLRGAGKKVEIYFHPVELKHLNDTEGIYEAATQSLNEVAGSEGEKLVTLYLSPGTPVMAFVWAFAALRHPTLKKRLIASSQPKLPPEKIVLPNEWLEWHGRQVRTSESVSEQYDVIFHLFGEQRMPSLLGILQFSSRKHIFINTKQFPANVMKQFLGESDFGEISVSPYDPENVRSTILDYVSKMPSDIRIGFNLTGGTKLMYAGALAACRKLNATPFYFSSQNNKVIYLNNFTSVDPKGISSVETFIKLNGTDLFISESGHWDDIPGVNSSDRTELTNELWQSRDKISRLYRKLLNYNDKFEPFELHNGKIYAKLSMDKSVKISIGSKHFEFKEWPDFADYLIGGWFEEYTYLKLQPLVNAGMIKDLRIRLKVSYKENKKHKKSIDIKDQLVQLFRNTYQELDISFTDGKYLYIVECKAGRRILGEYINKLESITRYFGGIEGKAILACCFAPTSTIITKKAAEAKNLSLVSEKDYVSQIKDIIRAEKKF